jgi:phage FluMu protein Com
MYKHDARCAYCGDISTDNEHVIPYSYVTKIPKSMRGRRKKDSHHGKNPNIVRSCRECNSLASNFVFNSFLEKKKYICERVKRRHRKVINCPEWTDEEIEEQDFFLKRYLVHFMLAKKRIEIRIENLEKPCVIE